MNINSTRKKFKRFIRVDLGDKYHQVCVTDKNGNTLEETSIPNERIALQRLCQKRPESAPSRSKLGRTAPGSAACLRLEG